VASTTSAGVHIGEIHYNRQDLDQGTISHEATHAILEWARRQGLTFTIPSTLPPRMRMRSGSARLGALTSRLARAYIGRVCCHGRLHTRPLFLTMRSTTAKRRSPVAAAIRRSRRSASRLILVVMRECHFFFSSCAM
jgi:hypothetical protein